MVIRGVPGAGKTALLREYVIRVLGRVDATPTPAEDAPMGQQPNTGSPAARDETERPIIPVPLRPGDLDSPPAAILQEIDRQFREYEASGEWGGIVNRGS